jgi:peptidoglycan/xylan/chitin deacetylase (PgdA/CDA1 family)
VRELDCGGSFVSTKSSGQTLAILGFHKIGEPSPRGWKSWFYIPEETFVSYLSHLREDGWQVLDVTTFLCGLERPDSLPERAMLLTFDDGYRSMREVALPRLRQFGYPAVLFVPTDYIGGWNAFDNGVEPEEATCDWDDLRELERSGVSIQSHGASHRWFSKLDLIEQEEELYRSRAVLESNLGKRVDVFAFPYGDNGGNQKEVARMLRRAGYRAACLYGGGPIALPIPDPYCLTRLAMGPDTDLQAALGQRITS